MWQNSFKIAWRNLWRQRSFTLINILGLTVSVTACLLLYRLVQYERSFDRHHRKLERIARIITQNTTAEGVDYTAGLPFPAMDAIQAAVPQIEQYTR